jgi:Ca-activated chloride channel family protein
MEEGARRDTLDVIDEMDAFGGTALVDAVYAAVTDIAAQEDTGAINAIVVMTDGQENESYYRLHDLEALLDSTSSARPVIFTIAFGNDADEALLTEMARIGQGQFRRADETEIEELYRIISTYF